MENNMVENEEAQQLKTLNIYRKLVQAILFNRKYLLLFIFIVALVCVMATMQKLVSMSQFRYTAKTTLIYYPKRTNKIGYIDENQVQRIFSRNAMHHKLAESMNVGNDKGRVADYSVDVRQDWKQRNLYTIETHSSNKDDAINATNLMAELCIKEYVAFRIEDLGKWGETVNTRKKELSESLKKIEDELTQLSQDTGVGDPEQELGRIKVTIAQLRNTRTDLQVQLTNAKVSKSNVELLLKNIDTNALLNISQLRDFESELKKADEEIANLRNLYTDKNPRLSSVIEKRNAIVRKYNEFVKEKNIKNFNLEALSKASELQDKLRTSMINVEALTEKLSVLDSEISANEAIVKKLTAIIPHITQITHDRESLHKALKDLDSDSSSINYLLASVKNDMSQVERCDSVIAQNPFSITNIILAVIAGLGCMFIAATLLAFSGVVFGNVSALDELQAYQELNALGAIPESLKCYDDAGIDNRTVLDSIFYNFLQVDAPKKIVFLGALPGAQYPDSLKEGMNWNYAMSGKRLLHLKIVHSSAFTEPTGKDVKFLGAACYQGMDGETPAENPRALSQSELNLLQSDLEELQNEFDTVFISSDEPIDNFGVFFEQMLKLCDSAIILIGSHRSPRALLRYVVAKQHETGRCVMSILTNSKDTEIRRG